MSEKIITRGVFKGYKIVESKRDNIKQQQENVDKILWIIGELTGIKGAWVSDESRLSDFPLSEDHIKGISKRLGFDINRRDYIYEIALRMKPAN